MTRSNSENDGVGSLCAADVLKKLGPYFLETKILNVVLDGASHAAPRFVRWGPTRDNEDERVPAVFIPLIPEPLFVESSEPLFANVAMTDWHQETDEWHLWEVLYKSGRTSSCFSQSSDTTTKFSSPILIQLSQLNFSLTLAHCPSQSPGQTSILQMDGEAFFCSTEGANSFQSKYLRNE
jgi:hypothetical protein